MANSSELWKIKYGGLNIYLRKNVIDDYWVTEGLLFANEYPDMGISKNDILLDVGANIGIYTLLNYRKAKLVVSIEPEQYNFEVLKRNVETNNISNVVLVNKAVGSKKGLVGMNTTGGSARVEGKGSIEMTTLDNIIDELNVKPTVMKMDIEGYEAEALRGFSNGLNYVKKIVMEVHSPSLLEEVKMILAKYGFSVKDISKPNYFTVMKNILWHMGTFLSLERKYGFFTTKAVIKHILMRGPNPIASANEGSGQYIIMAVK